jgi:anti-sigma B factor antagonist
MEPVSRVFTATLGPTERGAAITLTGELDMATAPELNDVLAPLVDDGPEEVVLDLAELSFIDSSGLAVLVTAQNALQEKGRRLVVRSPGRHARRVFEIAGLLEFLSVEAEPTEDARSSE